MAWRRTTSIVAAGILAGCAQTPPPTKPADSKAVRPVFCYRTLADVDCYTEADPGRESRLTAIYPFVGEPWWVAYAAGGEPPRQGESPAVGPPPLPLVSP